ncbi:BTAD domain-containing putative transcriptional regulator [Nonomuraea mesophila]|uniref:BTAD domain-containing putative transcriptional regulator n=1 Tax=Nonomuraea mesophila TaxID=2530382 RepID=UPI001FEC35E2|nr:BTAD domain-containing putative transcriptional regulator [Nonomuraea mesophila]
MEYRILGPIEVVRDGLVLPVPAAKLRTLLAALLVNANDVVTVDTLIDQLWNHNPPDGARNTLQNYVLRLRRLLGTGADCPLVTRPHGYTIEVAPGSLDLYVFDILVRRARTAAAADETDRAATLLRQALRLWRGEALADVSSDALRREVAAALDERRLDALELRIETDLTLGLHQILLPELRSLTAVHPLRERFWAQRMLALYRSERRSEALDCYQTIRGLLSSELGVDPGAELRDLHRRLLTGEITPLCPVRPRSRGNLPADVTTFVGRKQLLAQVGRLLTGNRLVTLTGVGGVGKTRLALQAGAELSGMFPDGVWLADLTALPEPRLLDQLVAQALELRDQSTRCPLDVVTEHLRSKRLLLVLDNCEHVVTAVATLVDVLLKACPKLKVLTTSRHRLGLTCEHVLLVPSLSLPPVPTGGPRGESPPALTGYEAIELLADRAAAAAPGFAITLDNQQRVAQLCRRLDGIPLAIELAAVRLGTLSVDEILDRIGDGFDLLAAPGTTTPRNHQTLRHVIDWSHRLCTEPERLLWERLSVFAGEFDVAAAEAVCSGCGVDRSDIVDLLAALVHKSVLLARTHGRRTRYRLLETLRQYGRRRLREAGMEEPLRRRHRDHYQRMAAQAAERWCGEQEIEWLSALRRELPNFREALTFSLGDPDQAIHGLEIAVNLTRTRVWFFAQALGEGRLWLERAYDAVPEHGPSRIIVAALLKWSALVVGDRSTAGRYPSTDEGHRADPVVSAIVTYAEGSHALLVHGDPHAIALLARARGGFERAGMYGDAHMTTMLWAMSCAFLGDARTARAAARDYLAEAEACGAGWAYTWTLWVLGLVELRHGDVGRSAASFGEALRRQYDIDDCWGPVWAVEALAWSAAACERHHRAAELLGVAHRMRRLVGVTLTELRPFHDLHAAAERRARTVLGEEAYLAAFTRGGQVTDIQRFVLDEGLAGETVQGRAHTPAGPRHGE